MMYRFQKLLNKQVKGFVNKPRSHFVPSDSQCLQGIV